MGKYIEVIPLELAGRGSRTNLPLYDNMDSALKNYIMELGGITKEVCEHDEILNIFLPMIRSDFKLVETYKCKKIIPCNCDISILYSEEDKSIDLNKMNKWKMHTKAKCNFYNYSSGHFFNV